MKKFKEKTDAFGRFAFDVNIGKVRISNEDQAIGLYNPQGDALLIVCDGMGGQNKGDLASSLAVSYLTDSFRSINKFISKAHIIYWISKSIRNANKTIYSEANKNPSYIGMGTTLSLVLIHKKTLFIAQIGDSRVYQLKDNRLQQLTDDQTYVSYLYKTGQIRKEEMKTHPKRHMLMNALGIYPTVNIDLSRHVYNGESILVCSDGLYNNVNDVTIASVLRSKDTPEQKVNELINIANKNGGSDNIGLVIWESAYGN